MRIAKSAHAAGFAIAALWTGFPTERMSAAAAPSALELRVITYESLTAADVELARQTATDLLATGGLRVLWRSCQGDGCAGPADGRLVVKVHLLPVTKHFDPSISGEVGLDSATNRPIVLVYVPRTLAVTEEIRRSRLGQTHPSLTALAPGHVVGLTIAHEIGHIFGLGHSTSGPMKAHLYPEDVIAMTQSLLRFPKISLPDAVAVRRRARHP